MNNLFNFVASPFEEGVTLGQDGVRVLRISTPVERERFKYQEILGQATGQETDHYWSVIDAARQEPTHEVGDWNFGEFVDGEWMPY